jgi:DNA-binding PucR family transcriptional regulator
LVSGTNVREAPRIYLARPEHDMHADDPHTQAGHAASRPSAEQLDAVRELARILLPLTDEIAAGMADRLHEELVELNGESGGPLLNETRASCRSNIGQILRAFDRGEPLASLVTPPEAIEYARSYVLRELPLSVLLRAYRVGQAHFMDVWTAAMTDLVDDGATLGEALVASTRWIFGYVDRICNQLALEYAAAQEEWVRTPHAVRTETVRRILAGTIRDEGEAERLLGHELRRRYHLGLVAWASRDGGGADARALQRAATDAAAALGVSDTLVVHSGASELWLWGSVFDEPGSNAAAALAALSTPAAIRVAAGRVRPGLDGFTRSHFEARAAARVAVLAGSRAAPVTMYDDVELVSLLSADIERARAFVHDELRGLAGPDKPVARLRETMLVLLEEGMSNAHAAERLFVHHNTVVYRTARAQELLGRRIVDRRFQVTAALLLVQTLGDAVLAPGPP